MKGKLSWFDKIMIVAAYAEAGVEHPSHEGSGRSDKIQAARDGKARLREAIKNGGIAAAVSRG